MSNGNGNAVVKAPVGTGGQLAAFVPQNLDEAWRLANALASSGMTPKAYGTDPNKVMVGIMAGAELGLTPFAALQSIAVIGNNPAVWGDGMLALVEASGLLEDIEETDDGEVATCRVVRKGRPTPIVRTFSNDDAKAAGLLGKSGPWTQYRRRMRQMRARGFALRDAFADVLRGMKMAEEVRDYAPMTGGALSTAASLSATALIEQAQAEPASAEDIASAKRAEQVDAYIAAISDPNIVATTEQLREYQLDERRAKWLAGIREQYPDLHDRVVAANSARLAELEGDDGFPDDRGNDGTLGLDNSGAGEGRDQHDMGEAFSGAEDDR